MKHCPKHVESYVVPATQLFREEQDDFHHYFQIVCQCGSLHFFLFVGTKRSVHAICHRCLSRVCVYDLANYPAATKGRGEEVFNVESDTIKPAEVFVGYEYGELDDDETFDQNDLTWCQVFIKHEGAMRKILDDETA